MNCCRKTSDSTQGQKQAWLIFSREQLLYDIANMAYVEGHVMEEDKEHTRHTVIDIKEPGNVDRITRVLDLAHAVVIETLYPLTKNEAWCGESLTNQLTEKPSYCIGLTLPADYSHTTVHLLKELVHEYMVCRALADWLSSLKPESAATWADRAEAAKKAIDSAKNRRINNVRRRMHPF